MNGQPYFLNHDELAKKGIEGSKDNLPEWARGMTAFMTDDERKGMEK